MGDTGTIRTHTVTILILPHFEYAVPLLHDPDAHHYVPLYALCCLLRLSATDELHRVRRVVLGWSLCLLSLPRGVSRASASHHVAAWCLPYPTAVGSWFWQVSQRVRDRERKAQLRR
jgi:hypothetical protein